MATPADYLTAARAVDPSITGIAIPDPDDATTWRFSRGLVVEKKSQQAVTQTPVVGLSLREHAAVVAAVTDALAPPLRDEVPATLPVVTPIPEVPPAITAEAVLVWACHQLHIDPIVAMLEILHGGPIT